MNYYGSAELNTDDNDFKFGISLLKTAIKLGSEDAKRYADYHKWKSMEE